MCFRHRVAGISLRDRVRGSHIWGDLSVELLFLCVRGAS